ncbi:MAG: hypothetical protein AB7G47_02345 [Mycolicibacterium sp.]|uniref:hypothetical protein n=1 Tax=Mycolicibacterium sp. TaxID=2320850 RepID=UPI003D134EBC
MSESALRGGTELAVKAGPLGIDRGHTSVRPSTWGPAAEMSDFTQRATICKIP